MSNSNTTDFTNPSTFILLGIPGLEASHVWISIPFCTMYAIAILGNFTVLFIVKMEPSLHGPMYYFLCMLAVTDLVLSTSILPKMLAIFWFNSREIDFDACLTQLYFTGCFSVMESGIIVTMGFDRYVAICHPLRHSTILTIPVVTKMGLAVMLRSRIAVIFPLPLLLKWFHYCGANVLSHSYCVHQEVMKLACSDITVNNIYGLHISLLMMGLDSLFIFLSYVMIFKTVLSVVSQTKCLRALNTCVSPLCVVLLFYTSEMVLSVIHRFGNSSTYLLQILLGYVYLLVPPLMNPVMYSMKSKHLRSRIIRLFVK
uniref:Olfactory receptor n=1 Tax=Gopherus evgoodei TaxID=1825980 RepID=A0A8C4YH54_9SAUR